MAQLGADVEALDRLATTFKTEADKVQGSIKVIEGKIGDAWWKGKDADKFRNDWTSHYKKDLLKVVAALEDAAKRVKTQSNQQKQVSGH